MEEDVRSSRQSVSHIPIFRTAKHPADSFIPASGAHSLVLLPQRVSGYCVLAKVISKTDFSGADVEGERV